MRDLGIKGVSGGTDVLRLASAVQTARSNRTFAAAFGDPMVVQDGDISIVMIKPQLPPKTHPNIYISALALALQNMNMITEELEFRSVESNFEKLDATRKKRNIIMTKDGTIVIATKNWIANRWKSQDTARRKS